MRPYLPFSALPIAAIAAYFAASYWSDSDPGRYRVPSVMQIEDPAALMASRSQRTDEPDIKVSAFLPQPPPVPARPEPTLILHGVMTGTGTRLATINGQLVEEGGWIGDYQVLRIDPDGVELASRGRTRRLPMRHLHELPPPAEAGESAATQKLAAGGSGPNLTQEFWKTFDSVER